MKTKLSARRQALAYGAAGAVGMLTATLSWTQIASYTAYAVMTGLFVSWMLVPIFKLMARP